MSAGTVLFYVAIFVGNIVIATEWARYGLLEIGIMRPPSRGIIFALFWGIAILGISTIVHLSTGWNPKVSEQAAFGLIAPAILWLFIFRYLILPSGLYEFNKAKIGTQYWAMQFYRPGKLEAEKAKTLVELGRALNALRLFDRAIGKQSKGTSVTSFDRTVTLTEEDSAWGRIRTRCPACPFEVDVPFETDRTLSGSCGMCGASLVCRIEENTLRLRAVLLRPVRVLTRQNRSNLTRIYSEKAWLLRMMGKMEEAQQALAEAETMNEELGSDDSQNRDYLSNKSMILFRRAEIYHCEGKKEEAKIGYTSSLQIDRQLGDEDGIAVIQGLLSELS